MRVSKGLLRQIDPPLTAPSTDVQQRNLLTDTRRSAQVSERSLGAAEDFGVSHFRAARYAELQADSNHKYKSPRPCTTRRIQMHDEPRLYVQFA